MRTVLLFIFLVLQLGVFASSSQSKGHEASSNSLVKRSDRRQGKSQRGRQVWQNEVGEEEGASNSGSSSSSSSSTFRPSFLRSDSFKTLANVAQGAIGGYVASQVINMDAQNRRGPGLGLADHESVNPFASPTALHAMAGAAVVSAVTDPTAAFSTVKNCFGEACRSLSFKRLSLNNEVDDEQEQQQQEEVTSDNTDQEEYEIESSQRGRRFGRNRSKRFQERARRMAKSREKKSLARQRSNVSSSS